MKGANKVRRVLTTAFPYMPPLTGNKTSRVVTKHFTNLPMYMDLDELALINWLVYQVGADNTFEYTSRLCDLFSMAIVEANKEYRQIEDKVPHLQVQRSPKIIRENLIKLIEKGYVFSVGQKLLMLSPMLTYRADYITAKEYDDICNKYQLLSDQDNLWIFLRKYREIINKKYKKVA